MVRFAEVPTGSEYWYPELVAVMSLLDSRAERDTWDSPARSLFHEWADFHGGAELFQCLRLDRFSLLEDLLKAAGDAGEEIFGIVSDVAYREPFPMPFPAVLISLRQGDVNFILNMSHSEGRPSVIDIELFARITDNEGEIGWPAVALWEIEREEAGAEAKNECYFIQNGSSHPLNEEWSARLHDLIQSVILELATIAALGQLGSAELKFTPPPEKLNRARSKRGKSPHRGYHRIVVRSSRSEVAASDSSERRASPRWHFRRGHYAAIKGTRVWRRWTMVGSVDLGSVSKEYRT